MRKSLIALGLAAALAACASAPPATPLAASGRGSLSGFATLALWGTWEMELAPAYTRLAAVRHRAAQRLDGGRLSVATAVEIQDLADRARANLDASRRGSQSDPGPAQKGALATAIRLIEQAEHTLEP